MNIIFEDDYILAVYKPSGLATQTSKIGEKDLFSEAKNHVNGNYIGIINRLDQPVSGIVLLAKSSETASALEKELQSHNMAKYYRAEVYIDRIEKREKLSVDITSDLSLFPNVLADYMCRDANNTSRICASDEANAKEARLEYAVRSIGEQTANLDIHLLTGRHHQIRVQLANAGMPILGDKKYGTDSSVKYSMLKRIRNVSLCAYRLIFTHPVTKQRIDLKADAWFT